MEPEHLSFGGGVAQTIVNPVVLAVVLIAGVLIWVLPRNKAIAPFIAAGILIPTDQVLVLGGLHFPMLRVLALFGFVLVFWRKFLRREVIFSGGMNGIDSALIILAVFVAVDGALLWRVSAETIYQLGTLSTTFGVYFLLRHLIRDEEDVKRALQVLACVAVAVAVLMTYEHITGQNPYYAVLGGAKAASLGSAVQRDGAYRSTGCFAHPIIAGTFGGILFPLFIGWWQREKRKYAVIGALAAAMIPFTVGSSTALFALLSGVGALLLWPLRKRMRILRWGIVIVLVSLHMVMKAPVWHLISRIDLAGGSSSYHRYMLVDQCIRHFSDWVLIGTKDYASWGWDMWDLSNQYVGTAETAGLIPFLAFVSILVLGFNYIGRARRYYERDIQQERFVWALGASLFANVVGFFGIGYWDQIIVPWYAILAVISATTLVARHPEPEFESNLLDKRLNFSPATPQYGTNFLMGAKRRAIHATYTHSDRQQKTKASGRA